MLEPHVVITEDIDNRCRKGNNTKLLIRAVQRTVSDHDLQHIKATQRRRFKNKYETAATFALQFPDIKQKMPKPPRLWEGEPVDAIYVEAIGLALEIVDPETKF